MQKQCKVLVDNLSKAIRGKPEAIQLLIAAMLARGHVLIEDVPGTGKTTLARALAKSVKADFKRVQFTPDLLPSDVSGGSIYNPENRSFEMIKGPVFTSFFLADEINRASPRTQSSLLEAMEERKVSIDGKTFTLSEFFMVLATQNPLEYHGVFPLPEAQIDRFMIRFSLGYPNVESELDILYDRYDQTDDLEGVLDIDDVLKMQKEVEQIKVAPEIGDYILNLVRDSREHDSLRLGGSPRASKNIFKLSQAFAYMEDMDHIKPEHVQKVWLSIMSHRVIIKPGYEVESVLEEIIHSRKVPV